MECINTLTQKYDVMPGFFFIIIFKTNLRPKIYRLYLIYSKVLMDIAYDIHISNLQKFTYNRFKNGHELESFKNAVDCSELN